MLSAYIMPHAPIARPAVGRGEEKKIAEQESAAMARNVELNAEIAEGHWLIFDENGKGATYNAPQFVKSGQVTQQPLMPQVKEPRARELPQARRHCLQ